MTQPATVAQEELVGFCYDDAPLLPIQWFTFYDCPEHRQCGLPCSVCGGKPVFQCQIKRVLSDNFQAWQTVGLLEKDPSALSRWVTLLATDVVVDWRGMYEDREKKVPLAPVQLRKEALLLRWNVFRVWVWSRAINEDSYRGNSVGGNASLDGGERAAA